MSNKLIIIDGNSIFYRSFYALPILSNSRGEYSNAVYGFAIQIINIIQNIKPKYMVVAFDVSKHTFRNDMYDGYKATRKPMPDELRSQIEPLKRMLKLMDVSIAEKEGLEGDDIIGIISKKFLDTETIIVTGDRDAFQLVDNSTSVYFTKRGTSDVKIMNEKELKLEYGVTPKQFIDLKALQGDTADNIPGVAGVGPKTAIELVTQYGDLDGIYENIDKISGKLKEKLVQGKEMAYLSRKLATIVTKGDLELSLKDLEYQFPFSAEVKEFFNYYEFKSLIKNDNIFDMTKGEKKIETCEILKINNNKDAEEVLKKLESVKEFSLFSEKNAILIAFDDKQYLFDLNYDLLSNGVNIGEFIEHFKNILSSNDILKIL